MAIISNNRVGKTKVTDSKQTSTPTTLASLYFIIQAGLVRFLPSTKINLSISCKDEETTLILYFIFTMIESFNHSISTVDARTWQDITVTKIILVGLECWKGLLL